MRRKLPATFLSRSLSSPSQPLIDLRCGDCRAPTVAAKDRSPRRNAATDAKRATGTALRTDPIPLWRPTSLQAPREAVEKRCRGGGEGYFGLAME